MRPEQDEEANGVKARLGVDKPAFRAPQSLQKRNVIR
jgi:hypothetical protein